MTALLILGGIAVVLALLCSLSVTLYVHWNEELSLQVGAAGIRFWLLNPNEEEAEEETQAEKKKEEAAQKKKQQKKAKKHGKKTAKEKVQEAVGDTKKTRSFSELMELILGLASAALGPLGDILKHLRITALSVRMAVGAEDAHETAILYAQIGAAFYNVLALLKANLTVKVRRVELNANFVSGEVEQDVSFKVKIRIGVLLWNGLRILGRYLSKLLKKNQPEPQAATAQPTVKEV